jgi:hypothetical protein
LITIPCDTPCEILMVAKDGLATLDEAEDNSPPIGLSFGEATASGLGS